MQLAIDRADSVKEGDLALFVDRTGLVILQEIGDISGDYTYRQGHCKRFQFTNGRSVSIHRYAKLLVVREE